MNDDPSHFTMTAREAATVLGISVGTLAQWRTQRRSPVYAIRDRRVHYRPADVYALRRAREAGVVVQAGQDPA